MSYIKKREQADLLQKKINAHGELKADIKKKIDYKFRLDWNYYSNSMEGNTLTMDETRSVMVGNLTVGGKPIKDVLEMKGHDEVISEILKIARGDLRLSEHRIKEIHRGIMHEEDESKRSKIGIWKTEPNYMYNYKNERFDFVLPAEVPDRIHTLLNKTNAAIDAIRANKMNAPHPLDIALSFHLEYVVIHPFYDGNGRTARILTNLLLISFGYPPFWIKTNERTIYNQYIGDIQGYGGNPDLFNEFATSLILRSQQLVLDAIEGKEIEEPDDIDKKLALLEKELDALDPGEEIRKHFDKDTFVEILNTWGTELLEKSIPAIQKFNRLFTGIGHWVSIQNGLGSVQFVDEPVTEIIEKLKLDFLRNSDKINTHDTKLKVTAFYGTFKKGGLNTFGCSYGFEVRFDLIKYEVWVDIFSENNQRNQEMRYQRLLHKPLSETEITKLVKHLEETIYQHIDFQTKKNGLR